MQESWMTVQGFPDYEISSRGTVRRIKDVVGTLLGVENGNISSLTMARRGAVGSQRKKRRSGSPIKCRWTTKWDFVRLVQVQLNCTQ